MKKIYAYLVILLFLCTALPGFGAAVSKDKTYTVPKAESKVKIDGVLDDKVWENALVLPLEYEVDPGKNIKAPVKTEVLLVYGAKHVYVGFRAYDPNPAQIRARYSDRDLIYDDDIVGIKFDSFNDSRRAYAFYCNPLGVQADRVELLTVGGDEWDTIWDSAGKLNDKGYTVEMAIPFSTLRFHKSKNNQPLEWKFDAERRWPRHYTHVMGLFPRDRDTNCWICDMVKIKGFQGANPGHNLEIAPTISGIYTQERESFPDGDFSTKTKQVDPGVTIKWGITPGTILNAAVNPDFSHVEADAPQLEINRQYALFYPEKRPFFQEGLSLFYTRFFAVHTRTISDPDWGLKLTSKMGRHAFGVFSVQDNYTNFIFPTSQTSESVTLNMNNQSTVLRYRYDLGKSSNMGVLVTDREGEGYHNRVASMGGDIRITKTHRFMFQFLGSSTQYPDDVAAQYGMFKGEETGYAFTSLYRYASEHFIFYLAHQRISPHFRADLGYMPQSDFIWWRSGFEYLWRGSPKQWFRMIRLGYRYDSEVNNDGHLNYKGFQAWIRYFGPLQSNLELFTNIGTKTFLGPRFRDNYGTIIGGFWPTSNINIAFESYFGDQVDFDHVRAGERLMLKPIINFRMGKSLTIGFDHTYEKLNVDAGRLYTANLSNMKLLYHFNNKTFLRAIIQYADYKYNSDLYNIPTDPRYKHLFTQFLFSYKLNPHTILFLGYSDDYYGYRMVPMKQNNRTLFLKIGYALNM